MTEADVLEFWNRPRPGAIALWVRSMVVLACVTSVATAALGASMLWELASTRGGLDPFWFRNGLAIALAASFTIAFVLPSKVSRFARVAVLLPVAHLVAMVVVWRLWASVASRSSSKDVTPLVERLPISAIVVGLGLACLAVAWLAARRRRRGEWLQGMVTMTLVELLATGLWLPIASRLWCARSRYEGWLDVGDVLHSPLRFTALVLVPPFLVAAAFTVVMLRRPELLRRRRGLLIACALTMFACAVSSRCEAPEAVCVLYANLVHVVMGMAVLAISALIALVAATWLRARKSRRALADDRACRTGVIAFDDADDHVVAGFEITSWLRGPRVLLRPFIVTTVHGDVPVPGGAELVAPLPLATTQLEAGEAAVVLRQGERVVVAGYVEDTGDHPFRTSSAPIAGPGGIRVSPRRLDDLRANDDGYGFTQLVLAAWRPCVAYLVILVAVALPGLVAAFTRPH